MAAPMVKTGVPGIYKRGSKYVVVYYADGRQRKESARTMAEARRIKDARRTDVARGEFFAESRLPFEEYASEWIENYHGAGSKGFRESTRDDYRRNLKYAFEFFKGKRLIDIRPRDVSRFVNWLNDESKQGRQLSPSTIRNIVAPVRSCLNTAVEHELSRRNPAEKVTYPSKVATGDTLDGEFDERAQAFTRRQLGDFLAIVHPRYRVMFELLAATGLRVSELRALQWRHLQLDGSAPHVAVRRQLYRGRLQSPKSKYGRRDVPLDLTLVSKLRAHRHESRWPGEEDLVFPSTTGTPFLDSNISRRILKPAAEEAGLSSASFHTFRHTCASMLFAEGRNILQVQRFLGHHSPEFTLRVYGHLMDEGVGAPLRLSPTSSAEAAPPSVQLVEAA